MHPNVARVRGALETAGCAAEIRELDVPTPTAATAAEALGTTVERIANSLIFDADGDAVLVLTSGANRVDLAKVGTLLGATVRRADPQLVRDATGFTIGGVPPVAHAQPLRTLVDRDLLQCDVVWAAGGTHNTLFAIDPHELVRITGGQVADVRVER